MAPQLPLSGLNPIDVMPDFLHLSHPNLITAGGFLRRNAQGLANSPNMTFLFKFIRVHSWLSALEVFA